MWRVKAKKLIEEIVLPILRFRRLFLFCNDLVPVRIDFLSVEAAIEKYSTKSSVKKFRFALHWSCPRIVVKALENNTEGITKKMIFLKGIFQGF